MTATPIPRTLALTAYGDLDVSVLDELPPGRRAIETRVGSTSARRQAVDLVQRELAASHQAYVVYPLIEESEGADGVAAATTEVEEWRQALPAARVGLLHGRMSAVEKEAVMAAFARGTLQVLVTTTVIEVGVDVPNATVMVVEHAERFGLAQLHQLRGRVGRGTAPSTCLLAPHGRLSDEARSRLRAMVETQDGFVIAERDLELRGAGELLGTRQAGIPRFRVARLDRDRALIETARVAALRYLEEAGAEAVRIWLDRAAWDRSVRLAEAR
jgi:ATP-dependent DNA helicase RecG